MRRNIPIRPTTKHIRKRKEKSTKNSHLYLSKNLHYIMVLNDEFEPINKIPLSSKGLFSQIENHHPIYSDELLIFQTDEETGEAEYVRHFEPGYKYTIICKQYSEAHQRIRTFRNITKHPNNYYEIYQTGTLEKKTGHPFWDYFFTRHPRNYKIEGGLKLAYKAWMHGCGPKINFQEKTTAWINGSKIESQQINCTNFEPGIYKLVHESSIEKFEIRQPHYIPQSTCNGWIINEEQKPGIRQPKTVR